MAEHRAKAAAKPVSEEVEKLRKEVADFKAEAEKKVRLEQAKAKAHQTIATLVNRVETYATEVPRAASLFARNHEEAMELARLCDRELDRKGLDYNLDDVILRMEKRLELYGATGAAPQRSGTNETASEERASATNPAKVTTISNRVAAGRSVVSDDEFESMSFDERVRMLERRARSADG
jgi:hypothetical protein